RHADCRQRKLADFLCTGGIIQGLIRRGKRRIRHWRGCRMNPNNNLTYSACAAYSSHPRRGRV
ncbi:hypothetical protein C9Z87_18290, partial [Escherichia coli]